MDREVGQDVAPATPQPRSAQTAGLPASAATTAILALQRSAGNAAVSRVISGAAARPAGWPATRTLARQNVPSTVRPPMDGGTRAPMDGGTRAPMDGGTRAPMDGGTRAPMDAAARPGMDAALAAGSYAGERMRLQEFVAGGPYRIERFRTQSGGIFTPSYAPRENLLRIYLDVGCHFVDGLVYQPARPIRGGTAPGAWRPSNPQNALLMQAADRLNHMQPGPEARALAEQFRWTGRQKVQFMQHYEALVEQRWGGQHQFHMTRRFWEDQFANVQVLVTARDRTHPADHVSMTVVKIPENVNMGAETNRARVSEPSWIPGIRHPERWTDQVDMTVGSSSVRPINAPNLLHVRFVPNGDEPVSDARNRAALVQIGRYAQNTYGGVDERPEDARRGATVRARVPGFGSDLAGTSRRRFDRLVAALVTAGMADAPARLVHVPGGAGDEAVVSVGSEQGQHVALHETGHVFGLEDEYIVTPQTTGTGAPAGTVAGHSALARRAGVAEDTIHQSTDSVMAAGDVVRPQHYATFWEALEAITRQHWRLGGPQSVTPPTTGAAAP